MLRHLGVLHLMPLHTHFVCVLLTRCVTSPSFATLCRRVRQPRRGPLHPGPGGLLALRRGGGVPGVGRHGARPRPHHPAAAAVGGEWARRGGAQWVVHGEILNPGMRRGRMRRWTRTTGLPVESIWLPSARLHQSTTAPEYHLHAPGRHGRCRGVLSRVFPARTAAPRRLTHSALLPQHTPGLSPPATPHTPGPTPRPKGDPFTSDTPPRPPVPTHPPAGDPLAEQLRQRHG